MSARYLNSLIKISGSDGSIIWRLGGIKSDFVLDGFNFSSQHDGRFRGGNSSVTLVSLFDNASDDFNRQPTSAAVSSGKLIALYTDEQPMTARLVHQWEHPDGQLSRRRGNVQMLGNGNFFICFSEKCYVTEFTADGRLLFEGKFLGDRNGVYRGSKFNFTASPDDGPTVKTFAYRINQRDAAAVSYVSWNGATEVKTWKFYGSQNKNTEYQLLGEARKTGFETVFTTDAYSEWNYVEALAANGAVLGRSKAGRAILVSAQHSGPGFHPNLPDKSGSPTASATPAPSETTGELFTSPITSSTPSSGATQASSNGTSLSGSDSVLKRVGAKSAITGLVGMVLLLGLSFAAGWFVRKHNERCWHARKSSEMGEYLKVEAEEEQRQPLAVHDG